MVVARHGATGALLLLAATTVSSVRALAFPPVRGGGVRRTSSSLGAAADLDDDDDVVEIGAHVGSGSYGTVRLCAEPSNDGRPFRATGVAKRAWTADELRARKHVVDEERSRDAARRCRGYWEVERHCLEKLRDAGVVGRGVPTLAGVRRSTTNDHEWLVTDLVPGTKDGEPARALADVMGERDDDGGGHHLSAVSRELGLPAETSLEETLDTVLLSLLRVLSDVHACNVVHRDVKPANLLCDPNTQSLVLIDFGSAADMDPAKEQSLFSAFTGPRRVGLDDRVAVSPVYAAPEIFVKWDGSPLAFDVFSAALVFCQLLFDLTDDRSDAAFHRRLKDADYDLESWLSRELSRVTTVRPEGVAENALTYLGERRGAFRLLRDMFEPDPERRVSSEAARTRFERVLRNVGGDVDETDDVPPDGAFFEDVLSSAETCAIPEESTTTVSPSSDDDDDASVAAAPSDAPPRPLHYVATFPRGASLGLILSEHDADADAEATIERARANAKPGEVFVSEIVEGGRAEEMGIFEVGDRLSGVGDLPFVDFGFEKAVDMLTSQPKSAGTIKVHFDRRSAALTGEYSDVLTSAQEIDRDDAAAAASRPKVVGHGAWSETGRRKAQEDTFVLHEVPDSEGNTVLLAGVFDGHGGTAASNAVSRSLPTLLAAELGEKRPVRDALRSAWEVACRSYQSGCDENEDGCVAEYDPVQGIVMANVGSSDLVAGTTASVVAVSETDGAVVSLNCGDSRTLLVARKGEERRRRRSVVRFRTRDHTPKDESEAARLRAGADAGLDYSLPECSMSVWRLRVGDYRYSLSRSLEGRFATSKGIVYDADLTDVDDDVREGESGIIVAASDGLFEVMDSEEVGREMLKMREYGLSAGEAAKKICEKALKKGSYDNVSAVVVYFA